MLSLSLVGCIQKTLTYIIIIEFIDMALAHSIRVTDTFIYQEKLEIDMEKKAYEKKTWFIRYNNNGNYD